MPPENLPRRRFLQSSAVASGLVGVSFAGCTDLIDDDGGGGPGPDRDRPAYARYVPAEGLFADGEDGESLGGMYAFLDFETIAEYEDLDLEESFATPEEPVEGSGAGDLAFVAGPMIGLFVYVFGMFGLIGYSFTGDLLPEFDDSGGGDDGAAFETSVSVLTSFGYVFVGEYDVEAVGEAAEEFEAVDERDGFTVFEGQAPEDNDGFGFSLAEGLAFAANSEAVLVPLPDTDVGGSDDDSDDAERNREMLDTMIDVVAGEEASAADDDADVDWMLRTTGHGAFGIGTYGEGEDGAGGGRFDEEFGGEMGGGDSEFFDEETRQALEDIGTLLEDATVYGSSLELQGESEAVGHVALGYDSSDDVPSDEEFEEVFGDVSGEFSIESGETRVYLSATQSLESSGT